MILGDHRDAIVPSTSTTLDDLFRRAVQRHPETIALIDPPNRGSFTGGMRRRLTYAETDLMISAIAARLRDLGLPLDAVIGIQLPNTVESVLTLLGVLRAGLIAAPLPMLWRRGDMVAALNRVGAKALITCGRVGSTDHADLAMQTAADVFPIRYVCAFGENLPDGVVGFDDLYAEQNPKPPPPENERAGNRAAHLALLTWEQTTDGGVPVARNHAEIVAGGLAVLLEGRFETGAVFVSAVPSSSFAGLAASVLPWLLTGGALLLHQPFDPEALKEQLQDGCDAAVLPAPVIPSFSEAGFFNPQVRTVMGLWRSPERISSAPVWADASGMIDIACFGETCVIPIRRDADGRPGALPWGIVTAPHGAPGAILVAELTRIRDRSLAISGPMVPRYTYPSGTDHAKLPYFSAAECVIDTGYPCRIDHDARTLIVTGPPAGLADVGGYRFAVRDLQRLVGGFDIAGRIAALPDQLSGHRLAGTADNVPALQAALIQHGVNPLIAGAFT